MLKRTIYIGNPAYLKKQDYQMHILEPSTKEVKGSIPIEDMAMLVIDHFQVTLSSGLIIALQYHKVAIIVCNEQHLPHGLMLPLEAHTTYSDHVKYQIQASEPLKKQLWKQTVEAKIRNQQLLLSHINKAFEGLNPYLQNVKSGDSTNREGLAANYYWKQLFDDFNRRRDGESPNDILNFGYAILRSMVARAIVSSGLLPVLGIFHKNKYNAYTLADDVMEPYRPFVDKLVLELLEQAGSETLSLTKETKAYLLQMATMDVLINDSKSPLLVAISTTTASIVKCYKGEIRQISYPIFI